MKKRKIRKITRKKPNRRLSKSKKRTNRPRKTKRKTKTKTKTKKIFSKNNRNLKKIKTKSKYSKNRGFYGGTSIELGKLPTKFRNFFLEYQVIINTDWILIDNTAEGGTIKLVRKHHREQYSDVIEKTDVPEIFIKYRIPREPSILSNAMNTNYRIGNDFIKIMDTALLIKSDTPEFFKEIYNGIEVMNTCIQQIEEQINAVLDFNGKYTPIPKPENIKEIKEEDESKYEIYADFKEMDFIFRLLFQRTTNNDVQNYHEVLTKMTESKKSMKGGEFGRDNKVEPRENPNGKPTITINTTNGIITNITIEGKYYHRLQRLKRLIDPTDSNMHIFKRNSDTFYQNYSDIPMKYLRITTMIEQINKDMNKLKEEKIKPLNETIEKFLKYTISIDDELSYADIYKIEDVCKKQKHSLENGKPNSKKRKEIQDELDKIAREGLGIFRDYNEYYRGNEKVYISNYLNVSTKGGRITNHFERVRAAFEANKTSSNQSAKVNVEFALSSVDTKGYDENKTELKKEELKTTEHLRLLEKEKDTLLKQLENRTTFTLTDINTLKSIQWYEATINQLEAHLKTYLIEKTKTNQKKVELKTYLKALDDFKEHDIFRMFLLEEHAKYISHVLQVQPYN